MSINRPPVVTFPAYKPNSHYGPAPTRDYTGYSNDAFEQECQDIADRAAAKQQKAEKSLTNKISKFVKKLIK